MTYHLARSNKLEKGLHTIGNLALCQYVDPPLLTSIGSEIKAIVLYD